MKTSDSAAFAVLAFWLISFLTGCLQPQSWHLSARKEGDIVQLCLSNERTCPQEGGIDVDDISVYRYDSLGSNEIVWEAVAPRMNKQKISGTINYGIPPRGWTNKMTPPTPLCG